MTTPTTASSMSGKQLLSLMAFAAILMIGVILLGKNEIEKQMPTALNWSEQGLSYGEGRQEAECLAHASEAYEDCQDRNCRAQWGIFFARCLERAQALEGRCVGVADLKDRTASQQWRQNYCERLGVSDPHCPELAQWTQKFCLKP